MKRTAVSPVLAEVMLMTITLIAAIAVGGYVFGLIGSFTATAQVSATVVSISEAVANAAASKPICAGSASGSIIQLINTGSARATVQSISFTYGGKTYTNTPAATCIVSAAGAEYVIESGIGGAGSGTAGEQFVGYVSLSNGGSIWFTGTLQ